MWWSVIIINFLISSPRRCWGNGVEQLDELTIAKDSWRLSSILLSSNGTLLDVDSHPSALRWLANFERSLCLMFVCYFFIDDAEIVLVIMIMVIRLFVVVIRMKVLVTLYVYLHKWLHILIVIIKKLNFIHLRFSFFYNLLYTIVVM